MPERKPLRRGEIIGERVDRKVTDEAEHFERCPVCGGLVDMRDLAAVLEARWTAPASRGGQDTVADGRVPPHARPVSRAV
jgi:hypothetical protein